MGRDDRLPSVLVFNFYLSGNFRNDRTRRQAAPWRTLFLGPPYHTVPYQNMFHIVLLVVLANNSRLGKSRTRTGSISLSYLVLGFWQSSSPAQKGPQTTANTESEYEGVVNIPLGREEGNPDQVDDNGRKLHLWAAGHGWERVVKKLLE